MAKKKRSSKKRLNARQQRRPEAARSSRARIIRVLGLAIIGFAAVGALTFWRNTGVLSAGEAAAAVPPNRIGPEDAPVRIVEYGDFGCPSCRQWHNLGIKQQLLTAFGDQISFEFKHFPVITADSPKAAEAAQCAAEQKAFWDYHDYIYEQTPLAALGPANLKLYAGAIGLEQQAFDSCLDSGKFRDYVVADWQSAEDIGARGTPTFLINGQQVFPSCQAMAATIAQSLGIDRPQACGT